MTMTTKHIIFLDVDGPLIPGRMYYSTGSTSIIGACGNKLCDKFDPIAVDMIANLCDIFDARVVFNSMHSLSGADHMRWKARHNGMEDLLHPEEWITRYYHGIGERIEAIRDWLSRHPGIEEWVTFDDALVPTKRLVHIHFDYGITLDNYSKALFILQGELTTNEKKQQQKGETPNEGRAPEVPS